MSEQTVREALIERLQASKDDDGMWIDYNGDYIDVLNMPNTEPTRAEVYAREIDWPERKTQ